MPVYKLQWPLLQPTACQILYLSCPPTADYWAAGVLKMFFLFVFSHHGPSRRVTMGNTNLLFYSWAK